MNKKEITWGTPKRVVKFTEKIPENPIIKKRGKIKYCKKTKGDHFYIETERCQVGFFAKIFGCKELISYKCDLCGKKKTEFK